MSYKNTTSSRASNSTASTFRALREVVLEHGLFCELYTDLGSHYFYTPEPGAPSKTQLTQVGRALKQLGVRHIGAHSPEARVYCGPVLRHPAELVLPAVDLGGRVWLGRKPCKGGPAAPAFGG